MPEQSISHMLKCSDDILLLILDHCERPALYNLVLTSKSLRECFNGELYRNVHLASHNLGRLTEFEDEIRLDVWANTDDYWGSEGLVRRQRAFLRTMTESSNEYAPLVRNFSWTLKWVDDGDDSGALPDIDHQVWTVFSRLTNVESLDLASISIDGVFDPYVRQIPSSLSLFPQTTQLRLVGCIPHDLVVAILRSIDVLSLKSLSLSMLHEEGRLPDGSPMPENINKEHWDASWRKRVCRYVASDKTVEKSLMTAGIIFPGPMWVPFVPLIGKLASLQHLEIQIPPLEASDMGHISPDQEHYILVMVDLITSTALSLQTLSIDFLRRIEHDLTGCASARIHNLTIQAFRARISQTILPTFGSLFSKKEQWLSLRSASLTGFLGKYDTWQGLEHFDKITAMRTEMESSLASRGVTVKWQDESTMPGVLFLGYDCHISEDSLCQFMEAYEGLEEDHIDS